jgi:hypothetical protein
MPKFPRMSRAVYPVRLSRVMHVLACTSTDHQPCQRDFMPSGWMMLSYVLHHECLSASLFVSVLNVSNSFFDFWVARSKSAVYVFTGSL